MIHKLGVAAQIGHAQVAPLNNGVIHQRPFVDLNVGVAPNNAVSDDRSRAIHVPNSTRSTVQTVVVRNNAVHKTHSAVVEVHAPTQTSVIDDQTVCVDGRSKPSLVNTAPKSTLIAPNRAVAHHHTTTVVLINTPAVRGFVARNIAVGEMALGFVLRRNSTTPVKYFSRVNGLSGHKLGVATRNGEAVEQGVGVGAAKYHHVVNVVVGCRSADFAAQDGPPRQTHLTARRGS